MTRRCFAGMLAAPLFASSKPYRIEKLWKSPEGHPNAMESTPEGLWLVEQATDNAYLCDWKTGRVLRKLETESHNTSGVAFGDGKLWLGANGKSLFRPLRTTDRPGGEIIAADPSTGKTISRHPIPDGGGVHGVVWDNGTLWMTCFQWKALAQVDPKTFEVRHRIPVQHGRAHGLAIDGDAIWCVFSTDYLIQKLSKKDGRVLDEIQLKRGVDPDPHGLDIYQGALLYCDAGMQHPEPKLIETEHSGYISRIVR
jgi:streptogramin lyase